jgi:hypothetical protein
LIPDLRGLLAQARADRFVVGWVATLLLAAYASALVMDFGFTDDYWLLDATRHKDYADPFLGSGRPISFLLQRVGFGLAGDVGGLRWLRAVALAGVVAVAVLLFLVLRLYGMRRLPAAFVATAIAVLPPLQVAVAWGGLFTGPIALILGALAGVLAQRAALAGGRGALRPGLGATLALLVAMLIYQPAAMACILVLALGLLLQFPGPTITLRLCLASASVLAAAGALAFGILRICVAAVDAAPARSSLTSDVAGKLDWFVSEAAVNAFDPFQLPGRPAVALAVVLAVAVGLLLHAVTAPLRRLAALAAVPVLVPIAYLPNLLTSESWAAYRSLIILMPLAMLMVVVAARGYLGALRRLRPPTRMAGSVAGRALGGVWVAGTVLVVLAASRNLTGFCAQQADEFQRIDRSVQIALAGGASRIVMVPPLLFEGPRGRDVDYDEFGLPSTAQPWVPEPMLRLILRRRAPEQRVQVGATDRAGLGAYAKGWAVIDVRALIAGA